MPPKSPGGSSKDCPKCGTSYVYEASYQKHISKCQKRKQQGSESKSKKKAKRSSRDPLTLVSSPPTETPPTVNLSAEQCRARNAIVAGHNVTVLAKAGTGKTTFALQTARDYYNEYKRKTLILTYNSKLKSETRDRIKKQGLHERMECHSFHAFALDYDHQDKKGSLNIDDSLIDYALGQPAPFKTFDFSLVPTLFLFLSFFLSLPLSIHIYINIYYLIFLSNVNFSPLVPQIIGDR